MTPVRLELAALQSRVKHSITEPLRSPLLHMLTIKNRSNDIERVKVKKVLKGFSNEYNFSISI